MDVAIKSLKIICELAKSDDTNLNLRNIAMIAQHALATEGTTNMAEAKQQIITSTGKPMERVPVQPPQSLIEVIARAASDPSVDIEKMDRLLQMQERMQKNAAEAEFNEAMTTAQAEMGRIKTNKENSQTHSRYADYATLDRALRPIYTKHGFALSFNTLEAPAEIVRVEAYVSRGGFTRSYRVDMPSDGKGAKGNDVMTKTHATGAAMTYGMRYLLKMIFNVAIGEDDTDGNVPNAVITDDQAEELKKLIEDLAIEVDGDDRNYAGWLERFVEHMKVGALSEILAKNFDRAKTAIAQTRKAAVPK